MKINNYIKRITYLFLGVIIFLIISTPNIIKADMGPKPYVEIKFKNIDETNYFVTLLSKNERSGPHHYYNNEESKREGDYPEIWEKFQNYEDEYYFLQNYSKIDENKTFRWGYYPPRDFKLLIYFADIDKFIISEPQKATAFANYYTFDLKKINLSISDINDPVKIQHNKKIDVEIYNFLIRLIFTIVIEILIAILFKFTTKNQIITILLTNILTQVALNIILSLMIYYYGFNILLFPLIIIIELIIFLVEALAYNVVFRKWLKDGRKKYITTYTFIANALSFILGMLLLFIR